MSTMPTTCMHGDVDMSRPMHEWVLCHDRALYETQSTESHASGYPPTPMCSRHAEYARQHWNVHYIRTLTPEERTA